MPNKLIFKYILSGFILFLIFAPYLIFASNHTGGTPTGPTAEKIEFNIKIENPFKKGQAGGLYEFIKTIINDILLPIGGVVAVIMIMYAGFLYVTARGSETQIKKAHDAMLYSAIGAAILLGAWVIANAIGATIKNLQ